MKIVDKTQGKATTYDKINIGDVFKFEKAACNKLRSACD